MMNCSWLFINLKLCIFIKLYMNSAVRPATASSEPPKIDESELNKSELEAENDVVFGECSTERKILVPPLNCRGMKKLEKETFKKNIQVPCLTTSVYNLGNLRKLLRKFLIHLENFRPIQPFFNEDGRENVTKKNLIFDPDLVHSFDYFDKEIQQELSKMNITEKDFNFGSLAVEYENWRLEDVIRAVLPEGLSFSGFSVIGHIVHLNLRNELLDYKYIIGDVLLDKVTNVRTVVNKLSTIENTYRSFKMELLSGDDNMVAQVKENYCWFELDFSKVYWNSRLSTEHERIVKMLSKTDVLYDVFAGVGPFALPAAKKGCTVLANDLNPDSIKWLKHNCELNKVEDSVEIYNMDGNEFMFSVMKKHLVDHNKGNYMLYKYSNAHITMNLPNASDTFLQNFVGFFTPAEFSQISFKIFVHVYFFVKTRTKHLPTLKDDAIKFVENCLGTKIKYNLIEVLSVRHVAPTKKMFRVSFRLSAETLVRKSEKRKMEGNFYNKLENVKSEECADSYEK